jgi:hypothetical protein
MKSVSDYSAAILTAQQLTCVAVIPHHCSADSLFDSEMTTNIVIPDTIIVH